MGKVLGIKNWGYFIKVDPDKVDKKSNELTDENSKVYTYIVMPRLGMNLHNIFIKRKGHFTLE